MVRLVRFSMGAAALVLCLMWPATVAAQTTGTLIGTVKDAQGGVMPGVSVDLVSETKGTPGPTVVTNEVGDFVFVNLAPDTYKVQATLQGFRPVARGGLQLSAGDRVSLGVLTLQVGAMEESVFVTSEAPLLDTTTGTRAFTATRDQVEKLPVSARSFVAMAQLAPGVFNARANEGAESDYQVARIGAGPRDNSYMMDGASMMDTGSNRPVLQVNTEAVAEVKVIVSGYQAEYGRATGVIISGISKTGTNQFRGSLYDVERNSQWNSISKTDELNGDPKPFVRERDFGFSIGGPIGKPGGTNKWFFFFAMEMDPRTQGSTINRFRVPTALERTGDFSQSLDNNGVRYNLIQDPSSTLPCTAANTAGCFQDGGVIGKIPANRLYPLGLKILQWYPMPNVANVPAGQNYNLELATIEQSLTSYQPNLRLDYQHSDKMRWAWRYSRFQQAQDFVTFGVVPGFNDSKQPEPNAFSTTVNFNYTLNDKTFLEATVGGATDHTLNACPLNSGNQTGGQGAEFCRGGIIINESATRAGAGLQDLPQIYPNANVVNPEYYVYDRMNVVKPPVWDGTKLNYNPAFTFGSRVGGTQPTANYGTFGHNPSRDITASITRLEGSHSIKAGFYQTRVPKTGSNAASGTVSFAQDTVGTNPFDTSFGFANAAIGSFSSFSQPSMFNENVRLWTMNEAYVQDTWKMHSRLSLDYGVRFTNHGEQRDTLGQQSAFDFDAWKAANAAVSIYEPTCVGVAPCSGTNRRARNPRTGEVLGANSAILIGTVVPNTGNLTAGVTPTPGDRSTYAWPALVVGPRVGVAWDAFGNQRTIIRGTWGLFYPREGGGAEGRNNPGLNPTTTLRYSNFQSMGTAGLQPVSVPSVEGNVDENLPLSAQSQWNTGFQQMLPFDMMVDFSYVGVHGWGLPQSINQNGIDLGSAYLAKNQDPTLSSTVPGGNFLPVDLVRPYRGLANINITGTDSYQDTWSHSLQWGLVRRMSRGFSFGFNHARVLQSKTDVGLRLEHAADGSVHVRADQEKANDLLGSTIDRVDILKFNFIAAPPRLPNTNGALRAIGYILNDWQLSGVWTADTGRAYTVGYSYTSNGSATNLTGSPDYAARVRIVGDTGSGCSDDPYRMFNVNAFQGPVYGSDGLESGAGYLRDCGRGRWDLSLTRNIPVGGARAISLRADFFNVFNQQAITSVNSTMQLASPTAPGTITNLPYDASGAIIPARSQPKNAGFGMANGYQAGRSVQLQARFRF